MQLTQEEIRFLQPQAREEIIWDTRYDRIQLTAAATTIPASNVFFQKAIGGSNTLWDTNMTSAGSLEKGTRMFVKALNFRVWAQTLTTNTPIQSASGGLTAAIVNNIATIVNSIVLTPKILTKTYGSIPAHAVPAGGGLYGALAANEVAGAGAGSGHLENGVPDYRNAWPVKWPLPELAPFSINGTMDIATSPTLTSVSPFRMTLECRISGWAIRAIL